MITLSGRKVKTAVAAVVQSVSMNEAPHWATFHTLLHIALPEVREATPMDLAEAADAVAASHLLIDSTAAVEHRMNRPRNGKGRYPIMHGPRTSLLA